MKTLRRSILFGLLMLISIPSVGLAGKPKKEKVPPQPLTEEEARTAYAVGVNYLAAQLKAPSTARFQPIEEIQFAPESRILWYRHRIGFYIWVDAQNSFGAMLRTVFMCGVERNKPQPNCLCLDWSKMHGR